MTPYTEKELNEIIAWARWQDPLKKQKLPREKYFVADETTRAPNLPNWAFISKRNLWTTTWEGVTLVVSRELIGQRWNLYLGGEIKLGEAGTCQEMKERGTALLVVAKYGSQP